MRREMEKAWWANLRLWLGMACSALFLVLVFRNVRWVELAAALQNVNLAVLLLAAAVYALSLLMRGLCWQSLLTPLGPVSTKEAFSYANIGYMLNNLLPLRAGEVIRAALLAEKKCLSKSAVVATIVLERLLDVLILSALTMLLMVAMPIPSIAKRSILLALVVGCLVIIGLWWAAGRGWSDREEEPSSLYRRALHLVTSFGRSFSDGLLAVRSAKQAAAAGFYSLMAWMFVGASIYLMLMASHLRLPWRAALVVMVMVNLGSIIPSSPGSIGVVHFLAVMALSPWMVDREVAVGFSIVLHAVSVLVTVVLGGVCLWKEKIGIVRVNKSTLQASVGSTAP